MRAVFVHRMPIIFFFMVSHVLFGSSRATSPLPFARRLGFRCRLLGVSVGLAPGIGREEGGSDPEAREERKSDVARLSGSKPMGSIPFSPPHFRSGWIGILG